MSHYFALILALIFTGLSAAAESVSFVRQVAPLLREKCVECHREGKAKGGYRMDVFELLMRPGDSGVAAVTSGKPEASDVYARLTTSDEDERMPATGDALAEAEIALVRRWIAEGARYDHANPKAPLADVLEPSQRGKPTPAKYPRPLPITALAVNGDGTRIATSGYGEVLLWDAKSQKLVGRIEAMPERVLDLKWLGRGIYLAVAGGSPGRSGEVWMVNTQTLKPMKRLISTRDMCLSLAVSGDGHTLVVGSADNRIHAFATPEGKPLWALEAHADWVSALAFSPDGKLVASGSRDRTARLIDASTGEIKATYTNHESAVLSLTFLEGGKEVVSGSLDGELRRWNLEAKSDKSTTTRPGHGAVLAMASAGARTWVSLADKGLLEEDEKAKKVLRRLEGHGGRVNALALVIAEAAEPAKQQAVEQPKGQTQDQRPAGTAKPAPPQATKLISGDQEGMVRVWDLKENREIGKFLAVP